MIDTEKLERKIMVGVENKVEVSFSIRHLDVTVDGSGYNDKVKIQDGYIGEERSYRVSGSTSVSDVIEKEESIAETVDKARKLETTQEINNWQQVETSGSVFIKFINTTKEVDLSLDNRDNWLMNGTRKKSLTKAKYEMVEELEYRNPFREIINETAFDRLKKELTNVQGIGDRTARKLSSKASISGSDPIESFEDIKLYTPKHISRSTRQDAEVYMENQHPDPIKEAVHNKKKELVQDKDQKHLITQAL